LVDTDPQGSIGYSLRGSLRENVGLVEVLEGSVALDQAIRTTRLIQFSILALGQLAATAASRWSLSVEDGVSLAKALEPAREEYDLILLDTPPGPTGASLGSLRVADLAILPLQAEPLAARSLAKLLEILGGLRHEGTPTDVAGVVLTMVQARHKSSLQVVLDSWEMLPGQLVLEATVPRDPAFLEASAEGVPVALLRRQPPAVAAVFDQVASELALRMGLESEESDEEAISLLD